MEVRLRNTVILQIIAIVLWICLSSISIWAADGDLLWTFETNSWVRSSPAIGSDGTIYVGSMGLDEHLYAINPDGSLKWSYDMDNTAVGLTPAISPEGTIYINGKSGMYLFAINPDGTSYRWKTATFPGCSPAIGADGTIYVSNNTGKLYWLYDETGFRACGHIAEGDIHSSPAIATNGRIYFGDDEGYIYSVGPGCDSHWHFKTGGAITSSPAIDSDGTVYVGSGDGKLYAINPDGTKKWDFATGDRIESSPAIGPDDAVYVGSGDQKLYAVNTDGTLKWSYETSGFIHSSPAVGKNGVVYFGSYDKKIYAVNSGGTLRWSYETGAMIFSSPVIGTDGTVYIGSDDNKLYAIEDSSGGTAQTAWPMFRNNLRRTGFGGSNASPPVSEPNSWSFTESNKQNSCTTPDPLESGTANLTKDDYYYLMTSDGGTGHTCSGGFYENTFFSMEVYPFNNGMLRDYVSVSFTDDNNAAGISKWVWTSDTMDCTGSHEVTLSKSASSQISDSDGGGSGCFIGSLTP